MYDVTNWFWKIGGDSTKFWSSASAGFVAPDSQGYIEFLSRGGAATPISSLEELAGVFQQQYPGGMLLIYANAIQWDLATGGYQTTIEGQQIVFPTTPESMSLISGKVQRLSQPNPPATINWQIGAQEFVEIPAADFIVLATDIADFVQASFDKLKDVVIPGINGGTLTTREQVYAEFYGG